MFKLLEYQAKLQLVESARTQFTFKCPVCNSNLLKVNRKSGAYKCYANECSTEKIKAALGYRSTFYEENPVYAVPNNVYQRNSVVTEPTWGAIQFISIDNYDIPKVRELQTKTHTFFLYNEESMVERVDYRDGRKKQCFPKYKRGDIWQYGDNNKFELFNSRYVKNGTVLMAEGEKSANALTVASSYVTISAPPFGWEKDYLYKEFFKLKHFRGCNGIVYFPDNDEPGAKKAELVKLTAWSINLPIYVVPLASMFMMRESEDIADLIYREINILELLCQIRMKVSCSI